MTAEPAAHPPGFRPATAIAVVVANMIGTGVFTSLGFQLIDIDSGFVLMMLWFVGGITALCGALTYAELGACLPRSGGEYNFLTETYHPAAGFVSGWVSATIGFAAPTALAAITFGSYLSSMFPAIPVTLSACLLVIGVSLIHGTSRRNSSLLQESFTAIKIVVVIAFCVAAVLLVDTPQMTSFAPLPGDGTLLLGSAFAVSLIYVNYAYTGWNAATYLTGELREPQRNLPIVLIAGTGLVLVLYLALNATFLYVAPVDAMRGKVEIGYVAAGYAFGETGARFMGVILAGLLVSTVSAMMMAGPRVLQVIGQDFPLFKRLSATNRNEVPTTAIVFQAVLALAFILTSSFETILVLSGFTLGVNTLFAVGGIFILRARRPDLPRPYRTVLYPLPPLLYLGITLWTLVYILRERPLEGWLGLSVIAVGLACYFVSRRLGNGSSAA